MLSKLPPFTLLEYLKTLIQWNYAKLTKTEEELDQMFFDGVDVLPGILDFMLEGWMSATQLHWIASAYKFNYGKGSSRPFIFSWADLEELRLVQAVRNGRDLLHSLCQLSYTNCGVITNCIGTDRYQEICAMNLQDATNALRLKKPRQH